MKKSSPGKHQRKNQKTERRWGAEEWILTSALACFIIFLWMMLFLFVPLIAHRPLNVALPPAVIEAAATRGFVLPPTWTPSPTEYVAPTNLPTPVYDGAMPTRMYTPRPTSLPGLPVVFLPAHRGTLNEIEIVDLARILQGESPGDKEAAYYVGWVAKNRLLHPGYGSNFRAVSSGFFGYRASMQPREEFKEIARQVMRARVDPTAGCLYALSRTDITKLRVSPQRADLNIGEWFFFRTWPVDFSLFPAS